MSTREIRAEQLKNARASTGFTQGVFAEKLALPLSTYRRYEQAVTDIPIEVYVALAERWQCDLNELITGKKATRSTVEEPDDEILDGVVEKGLIQAISNGAQIGDADNIRKLKAGMSYAIRYVLRRDRNGLPL